MMCARLVRDWLTTNARTARIWVRDPLITSAFNATTSWRALLPTQTLQSASALITRFLVLTVPNVNAPTVRDWLMAQMTALTAALPWRALLPTQTLHSASALQTRCPVLTVPSAKIAQAFRYLMCARLVRDWLTTNARTARIWVRDRLITSALSAAPSWRALLPTQTLHSASALQTRCPVLTVPSAKIAQAFRYLMCARLVRDWLMANA